MLDALYARYSAVASGNGQRYAVAAQVRSHAGFDARRTADFIAMDLWPSQRLTLHGHEVKVSRSDWLRELKDPSKAAEFVPYMNCWWVVVSDARIVRDGELPDDWGLMAMRGPLLAVVKKAPSRDALPLTPSASLRSCGRSRKPPFTWSSGITSGGTSAIRTTASAPASRRRYREWPIGRPRDSAAFRQLLRRTCAPEGQALPARCCVPRSRPRGPRGRTSGTGTRLG